MTDKQRLKFNNTGPTKTRIRTKHCPFCAELIRYEAVKCRYCGEFLYGDRVHSIARAPWEPLTPTQENEPVVKEELEEEEAYDDEYEEVLYCGRPSIFAITRPFLTSTLWLALCAVIYYYPVSYLLTYIPKFQSNQALIMRIEGYLDMIAIGLGIAVLLMLVYKAAALKSIFYEVTPDRIEWSRGIFDRQVDNLDMFRVIDLKLRRSLWDCIVGVGTVSLTTKDESDPTFDFKKVRDCRYLYDVLKKAGLEADKEQNVIHLE